MTNLPQPPGMPGGSPEGMPQLPIPMPPIPGAAPGGTGSAVTGMAQDGIKAVKAASEGDAAKAVDAGLDTAATGAAMYFGGEPAAQVTNAVMKSEVGTAGKKGLIALIGVVVLAVVMSLMSAGAGAVGIVASLAGASIISCAPGGAAPSSSQNPSQDEVASMIYSQAMGLGFGEVGAIIAIGVGLGESGLQNNMTGDCWATDSACRYGRTSSRGVFQQMYFWAPTGTAWSGKPNPKKKVTLPNGNVVIDFSEYDDKNAWGLGGWATTDPRMNVPQSASTFLIGLGPGANSGLQGNSEFESIRNSDPFSITPTQMVRIAQAVQGFPVQHMGSYETNMMGARDYLKRIKSGEIPKVAFSRPLAGVASEHRVFKPWLKEIVKRLGNLPTTLSPAAGPPPSASPSPSASTATVAQIETAKKKKPKPKPSPSASPSASASPSPSASPSSADGASPDTPTVIEGDGITFLGDSVMVGMLQQNDPEEEMFGGPAIRNALGNTTVQDVLSADTANDSYGNSANMRKWRKDISTGPSIILVELGTNASSLNSVEGISKFMDLAGPSRRVFWFSQHYKGREQMQSALEQAATKYSNLYIIPVLDFMNPPGKYTTEAHPEYAYKDMWAAAMAAINAGGAPSVVGSNCDPSTGGFTEVPAGSSAEMLPGPEGALPQVGFTVNTPGGNNMMYYNQGDPRWPQGASYNFAACACGTTSVAMVIATLQPDPEYTPVKAYYEQKDKGGFPTGCGSYHSSLSRMASDHGLVVKPAVYGQIDWSLVRKTLEQGGLVIVSVRAGSAFFNGAGHFVVIRGYTADGRYLLADPGSINATVASGYTPNQFVINSGASYYLPAGKSF